MGRYIEKDKLPQFSLYKETDFPFAMMLEERKIQQLMRIQGKKRSHYHSLECDAKWRGATLDQLLNEFLANEQSIYKVKERVCKQKSGDVKTTVLGNSVNYDYKANDDLMRLAFMSQLALGKLVNLPCEYSNENDAEEETCFEYYSGDYCPQTLSVPKMIIMRSNPYKELKSQGPECLNPKHLFDRIDYGEHYVLVTEQDTAERSMVFIVRKVPYLGIEISMLDANNGISTFFLEKMPGSNNSDKPIFSLAKWSCCPRNADSCNKCMKGKKNDDCMYIFGKSDVSEVCGTKMFHIVTAVLQFVNLYFDYLDEKEAKKAESALLEDKPAEAPKQSELTSSDTKTHQTKDTVKSAKSNCRNPFLIQEFIYTDEEKKVIRRHRKYIASKKAPHVRRKHFRTLRNGSVIEVRASIIHKDDYRGFSSGLNVG